MINILIIGVGCFFSVCINYVFGQVLEKNWFVIVVDVDLQLVEVWVKGYFNGCFVWFDVIKVNDCCDLIGCVDLVVFFLFVYLYFEVVYDCIKFKKYFIIVFYVFQEFYCFGDEVCDWEFIFMGEMGLDFGIDYMLAMW